jgi:hypothetical protein
MYPEPCAHGSWFPNWLEARREGATPGIPESLHQEVLIVIFGGSDVGWCNLSGTHRQQRLGAI